MKRVSPLLVHRTARNVLFEQPGGEREQRGGEQQACAGQTAEAAHGTDEQQCNDPGENFAGQCRGRQET
jgi:hypothetical protein